MPNEKEETRVDAPVDITIAVSYATPRMVLKDHGAAEIKQYEIVKMETIQVNGRDAGLLIKANEVDEEGIGTVNPEEAIEVELND